MVCIPLRVVAKEINGSILAMIFGAGNLLFAILLPIGIGFSIVGLAR